MQRVLTLLAMGLCANALGSLPTRAQTAPEITLTRLDCGTPRATPEDISARFNDTATFSELKMALAYSCYLIKHGEDYLVWDAGQPMSAGVVAPKVSMVDQLAQLKIKPEQIRYVGISHYHGDHTGQVASFPQSTLLIGKGDWDVLTRPKPMPGANPAPFAHWISGGGKVEPVPLDKDVFGDGRVVMLNTPGHTPGHHSLLVKLAAMGTVLISGDLSHFRENYEKNGVPGFNVNRAETLASLDRFKQLAANLKATVILQHDPRDVGKLPAFPAAAK